MTRRPAVTLMEVLITMFIMAIGMLALLALFPVGAVSMGKALKDDRCASAANMAAQLAIALNVRHNTNLATLYTSQLGQTIPGSWPSGAPYDGPSFPVYVDAYAANNGLTYVGNPTAPFRGIARTNVSYAVQTNNTPPNPSTAQLIDRYFSLPNDITFLPSGLPDVTTGNVERGREYTWAYMLQRPQVLSHEAVNLTVVVYYKRATAVMNYEQAYAVNPAATQNQSGFVMTWNSPQPAPNLRRGTWLLDTTPITGTTNVPRADFYRVVNVDMQAGYAVVDVQPNIKGSTVNQVVVMDDVAEVFSKGTSWQP